MGDNTNVCFAMQWFLNFATPATCLKKCHDAPSPYLDEEIYVEVVPDTTLMLFVIST